MNDCRKCVNQCDGAHFWLNALETVSDGLDEIDHLINGPDLTAEEMNYWSQALETLLACQSTVVRELEQLAESCEQEEDPNA